MKTERFPIQDMDAVDLAFGGAGHGMTKLLPPYNSIPDEFKYGRSKWNRLVTTWFFSGVSDLELIPKDGVDKDKALRHVLEVANLERRIALAEIALQQASGALILIRFMGFAGVIALIITFFRMTKVLP